MAVKQMSNKNKREDKQDVKRPYRNDVILASASPRRREMFQAMGIPFRVCPSDVEEDIPMDLDPETFVMYLAFKKATDVASRERGLIIAADTVVVVKDEIVGKPGDEEEAFRVLSSMRNDHHRVLTGVCVIDNTADPDMKRCLCDTTYVFFKDYSDEELTAYVNTPEPYDKAGGYAIQMTFGKYIDHIEGDRNNVIGFPMYRVEELLYE